MTAPKTEWRAELEPGTQETWRVVERDRNGRVVRIIAEPEGHDKPTALDIAAVKEMKASLADAKEWLEELLGNPSNGSPNRKRLDVYCAALSKANGEGQ